MSDYDKNKIAISKELYDRICVWMADEEAYEAQLDERAASKSWNGNLGNG